MSRLNNARGLGLIELLILIIVVGILLAVAMQSMTTTVDEVRLNSTLQEMDLLARAIVGDERQVGGESRTDFGYVGDVGAFPPNLQALAHNPGGFSTWDGPYLPPTINEDSSGYRFDAWGKPYSYDGSTTIQSTGGGSTLEKRLALSADDYLHNNFTGIVVDSRGTPPGIDCADSVRIELTVPNGTGGTDGRALYPGSDGVFIFDSLPVGMHSLNLIYQPNVDTLRRFVTILPRHKETETFKFASDYFATGCGGGATVVSDTLDIRVEHDDDDAEEDAGGDPKLSNAKIELGQMSWVGVRFLNVAIPQGATIDAAYLSFRAADGNSEDTDLRLYGEDSDNGLRFSTDEDNLSGRSRTTASVIWNNVATWSNNQYYNSPDISSILQEIVDRPGWSSGSAIVILIQSTDPDGKRLIVSHDGQHPHAPLIHIEYSTP